MLANKSIWEKIKDKTRVSYNDIESYIYSQEYIDSMIHNDNSFNGIEYNPNLNIYTFEVETYKNEDEYQEIFFQKYLDGEISQKEYLDSEKSFLGMMEFLYNASETIIYYYNEDSLRKNSLFLKSSDILFNIENFEQKNDKFFLINDINFFKQLCYIAAREIERINFIFPNIQAIVVGFGLHGHIYTETPLSIELYDKLSKIINFYKK